MSDLVRPGAGVLFMKVGTHANEDLASIISRKQAEIAATGIAMWGYGGNTCHPRTMVQPFARSFQDKGAPIHLVMQRMDSRHFAEQIRAGQYSANGVDWIDIPPEINVLGSRFALVLKTLQVAELALPLAATRVAVGPSRGRLGSDYLRGQVDKACLEVGAVPEEIDLQEAQALEISLVAEIGDPFAVFLR